MPLQVRTHTLRCGCIIFFQWAKKEKRVEFCSWYMKRVNYDDSLVLLTSNTDMLGFHLSSPFVWCNTRNSFLAAAKQEQAALVNYLIIFWPCSFGWSTDQWLSSFWRVRYTTGGTPWNVISKQSYSRWILATIINNSSVLLVVCFSSLKLPGDGFEAKVRFSRFT